MKKYIIAIFFVMLYASQMLAQLNTFVIHKKDGTIIELPIDARIMTFSGQKIVNDNDYVKIESCDVKTPAYRGDKPQAIVKYGFYANFWGVYSDSIGICYSTSPGVTAENSTLVNIHTEKNQREIAITDLDFNTTYYYRAYLLYRGKYYYSTEHSLKTELPAMKWYMDIPDALQNAGIYVYPKEEAWNKCFEDSIFKTTYPNLRYKLTLQKWNQYLTVEKAKELSAKCNAKYECCDGCIYILDEIEGDYKEMFKWSECMINGSEGLITEANLTTLGPDTIICPESLNIPYNTYYKYTPINPSAIPSVLYFVGEPMLVGHEYDVEITMAPDAERADSLKLPSIVRVTYYNGDADNLGKGTVIVSKQEIDAKVCTKINFTIKPEDFAQNAIQIASRVTSSQVKSGTHTRTLRIATIKVTPIAKKETTE